MKNTENPDMPDCLQFQQTIQSLLDGRDPGQEDLCGHPAKCAGCAELLRMAQRMRSVLACRPVPKPSSDLGERIFAGVQGQVVRSRRHRRIAFGILSAVAASVLILVGVWSQRVPESAPVLVQVPDIAPEPQTAVPLEQNLAEARRAMVALTRRTGEVSLPESFSRLPDARVLQATEIDPRTDLQPAAESLQHVRDRALLGFEPLTQSAGRAMNFVWKEFVPSGSTN